MAALALSVVGTSIAGPIGGAVGGLLGGMLDNLLFPGPKQPLPMATTSTYGNAIPIVYGPQNRVGANLIWSSGFRLVQNKSLKFLAGKGGSAAQAQTYEADCAFAVAEGPLEPSWCQKIWANGTVIFDATAGTGSPTPDANGVVTWDVSFLTFQDFATIVVYPGNHAQLPDPTIEASLGAGNVAAYRGTAYIVINSLKLTTFGNAIPTINVLTKAGDTITLSAIVSDICARAGVGAANVSSSSLTTLCAGYQILSQTDCNAALQPLALCYNFDVAEVAGSLRFVPRGLPPYAAITVDQMGAYESTASPPDAFSWPKDPEIMAPQLATLTFKDPARDLQDNTQAARRTTGASQNNISNTVTITLTSDQARKICDRQLWEAQVGRQAFKTTLSDRLAWVECGRTFGVETPAGLDQVRITKVARGVNGISDIEGKRDFPSLYFSTAPAASASSGPNPLAIGGPVNPPLFIEPPTGFPGLSGPTLFIAVSGGDGTIVNDAWTGCTVYASTDNENFTNVGSVTQPATMGKLIADLPASDGRPDTTNHLDVTTAESGQEPPTISVYDAEIATAPYYVGGEFISAETVTGLGGSTYRLTNLWRANFGSHGDNHPIGQPFARIDSAIFRFPYPIGYIGRTVYFKFVSAGETLASAVTYTWTGVGSGYGTGTAGVPAAATITAATGGVQQGQIQLTPPGPLDNVTSVSIYRAPGAGASFSSATQIASVGAGTTAYTDPTAAPGATYTYFVVNQNAAGSATPSAGANVTALPGSVGPQFVAVTAAVALSAGQFVHLGGAGAVLADAADDTKPANGYVLVAVASGATADVYLPGSANSVLSGLTEGATYFLGAAGAITTTRPTTGALQIVGVADAATNLAFAPEPIVLL